MLIIDIYIVVIYTYINLLLKLTLIKRGKDMYNHAPSDYVCPFCLLLRELKMII